MGKSYRANTDWCAVTEFVPLNNSHSNFCSTDGDFSLYKQTFMLSRYHWQWQQCLTPELVNTTTSKVNKQLRRRKILQTKFIQSNQTQTKIDKFYFNKKYIRAKTYFASPFLPQKNQVFPSFGKNLPTLAVMEFIVSDVKRKAFS